LIILGIDPGSRITGFGFIHNEPNRMRYVESGHIKVRGDTFPQRLGNIFQQLSELIVAHQPQHMSIENVFMHKNADSALKLGQARGAAICAAFNAGMDVSEYAPREIKLALVGKGSAHKDQVKHMVIHLLALHKDLQVDEADALAIAICHAQHSAMENRTGIPAKAFSKRRSYRR
jgi:crossover junction endodeoxyribonuclease RuvC